MIDMEQLIYLINSAGFPIVACAFMFKQNRDLSKSIDQLNNTLISLDRRIEVLEMDQIDRRVKNEKEKSVTPK